MKRLSARWARILQGWRDELTRPVRILVAWLLAGGCLLLVLGVALDLQGATSSYPFLVSMLSSLTAACFGIPVALVAVRHLQGSQGALSRKMDVARLAASTADSLFVSVRSYVVDTGEYAMARYCLDSVLRYLEAPRPRPEPEDLRELAGNIKDGVAHFRKAVRDDMTRSEQSLVINNSWDHLYSHLRPLLQETGSHWIYPELKAFFLNSFGVEAYELATEHGRLPDPFAPLTPSVDSEALRVADLLQESAALIEQGSNDADRLAEAERRLSDVTDVYRLACEDDANLTKYMRKARDSLARNLLPGHDPSAEEGTEEEAENGADQISLVSMVRRRRRG